MAVAGCVSLCMSSWAHSPTLKRSDQQTAALGCQHSTLISLWWIEWKTCLILFLYQHRSICASTEINTGLHFYTLLDLDTRSVLTRKALHSITPQTSCHYRICQSLCFERGLPCKLYFCAICGHVKINCLLFLSSFFCWNWPVLCLCRTSDVQVWYSGRREVVRHITILLCRGVKFTSSILGAEQACRGI